MPKSELVNFRRALEYVVGEATRLHKTGVTGGDAVTQANWGAYAGWSVVDRNPPRAVQRIYEELAGRLK